MRPSRKGASMRMWNERRVGRRALCAVGAAALCGAVVFACGSDEPPACEGPGCLDVSVDTATPPDAPDGSSQPPDGGLSDAFDARSPDADDGSSPCVAQAGTLDTSFGDAGMIWLKLPAPSADAVLALDDGKVLVAGAENGGRSAILVRLLPDGTPDAAFGASGVVESFTGRFGTATKAIALQPDGKVLVAGSSRTTGTAGRITVARHLAGGELDPSFGVAGVVIAEYPGREAFANALTVRTDGRIIVGGTSEDAQTPAGTSDFDA